MTDDLMTAREVANYLKVELRTVYRYLKDGHLPAFRMGGQWRLRKEDIDRWLLEHAPIQIRRRQPPRLLVVDDDEAFRGLLDDLFRTRGYAVHGAESGKAALALLREMTFDLLIVDLRMPVMDGIELIRQAKDLHPDVRILVLTAYGDKRSAVEALRLNVTDYLEKPVESEVLVSTVERALKSGRERV